MKQTLTLPQQMVPNLKSMFILTLLTLMLLTQFNNTTRAKAELKLGDAEASGAVDTADIAKSDPQQEQD
jgi:hypothetical protein